MSQSWQDQVRAEGAQVLFEQQPKPTGWTSKTILRECIFQLSLVALTWSKYV